MTSRATGRLGEKIAEEYLKKKGYRILGKNYIPKFFSGPQRGEIDIIAKKDGVICFVEVKALMQKAGKAQNGQEQFLTILPEMKVNYVKQKKLIKTAQGWLMQNKIPFDSKWQIDVIAVEIDSLTQKAQIRHHPNLCL